MQLFRSILASVAFFAASAVADYEREDGVLVLGDDNLAGAIKEFPFLLVEFYAPWCGHCKQLAPEYAKAAEEFEDNDEVELAKVDATVHNTVAAKYEVSGYPTIKFFKNGQVSEFNGGRTAEDIVAWLERKSGPSVIVAEDAAAVETLKETNPLVLVLHTTDASEENKALKHFTKVADSSDDVKFVLVSDAAVAAELEIEGESTVVLFKQFDEGRVDYHSDKVTKTKLEAFLKPHLLPLVVEFTDEWATRIFGGDVKEHLLYFRKDVDSDEDKAIIDSLRVVSKKHQGELLFVSVNMDGESNARLGEFFALQDSEYPTVRIVDIRGGPQKFKAPEGFELTEDGFELFVSKYVGGELNPALNSEDVPEDWDSDALKIVVGTSFKEVCLDETKNVLLMAHAPWCGHCKSLMPVFEELAEHFEDDDKVVIAKMDSTKNEVTEFSVTGFPTLKFFPSGSSEIVDFAGERDLDGLIAYINDNRGDAVEGSDEEEEHDEL